MKRDKSAIARRFLTTYVLLGVAGVAATIFVLVHERVQLPFQSVYAVHARFSAADGVIGGIGQPVQVAGVNVGQVTSVDLKDGVADVTLQIRRDQLAHVRADATAVLTPVTPLDDMEVELDPGHAPAPLLPDGATISTQNTTDPVQLSELLSTLDSDTRDYLSGLLGATDKATHGAAPDLRRLLLELGPTTQQVGQISAALASRQTELAQFVHNLASLTRAASQDGQLQTVVAAGQQTLHAIAAQSSALGSTIAQLPATLDAARTTLERLTPFAGQLQPTLNALLPAVHRLPSTLTQLGGLAQRAAAVLSDPVRPFVTSAAPVVNDLASALPDLQRTAAPLTGVAQTLDYTLNELSYVPGASDQGYLFWADWFLHNLNSTLSGADANGAIIRGSLLVSCGSLPGVTAVKTLLAPLGVCQ